MEWILSLLHPLHMHQGEIALCGLRTCNMLEIDFMARCTVEKGGKVRVKIDFWHYCNNNSNRNEEWMES